MNDPCPHNPLRNHAPVSPVSVMTWLVLVSLVFATTATSDAALAGAASAGTVRIAHAVSGETTLQRRADVQRDRLRPAAFSPCHSGIRLRAPADLSSAIARDSLARSPRPPRHTERAELIALPPPTL